MNAANLPFTWLRACGLRSIDVVLSMGLEDGQALAAVLEATYSQGKRQLLSSAGVQQLIGRPAQLVSRNM